MSRNGSISRIVKTLLTPTAALHIHQIQLFASLIGRIVETQQNLAHTTFYKSYQSLVRHPSQCTLKFIYFHLYSPLCLLSTPTFLLRQYFPFIFCIGISPKTSMIQMWTSSQNGALSVIEQCLILGAHKPIIGHSIWMLMTYFLPAFYQRTDCRRPGTWPNETLYVTLSLSHY